MNEILPFERSYCRLILANFHFMLKSIKNYSFCVKLEPATILVDKTMDLTPVICSIVVIIEMHILYLKVCSIWREPTDRHADILHEKSLP